jgi:hypothetical protein
LVQTYQSGKNVTNDHKLYQTAINHAKWPWTIPTFSIPRPSKIYLNWSLK